MCLTRSGAPTQIAHLGPFDEPAPKPTALPIPFFRCACYTVSHWRRLSAHLSYRTASPGIEPTPERGGVLFVTTSCLPRCSGVGNNPSNRMLTEPALPNVGRSGLSAIRTNIWDQRRKRSWQKAKCAETVKFESRRKTRASSRPALSKALRSSLPAAMLRLARKIRSDHLTATCSGIACDSSSGAT